MRTTISVSLPPRDAQKTRALARRRGFENMSDYVRFLLSADDVDLISEDEILRRSASVDVLQKRGNLVKAASMAELLK